MVGDAVWWQDGLIRKVGCALELERQVPSWVPRYDLPAAVVTPGFVDGHTHFGLWALNRQRVQLGGASSRAVALERIRLGTTERGWLRGHGWDANRWEAPPDRWSLDQVTSIPAFFESVDVHAGWANSAALRLAGISGATPDPAGGRIIRDASGEPTGLLLERAQELVIACLPAADPARLLGLIRETQSVAHRFGITGVHDVEGIEVLRAFRSLETAGELKLRVLFQPPVAHLATLLAQGVRSGAGTDWLRLGGVKLFLDGGLGSRTAWMLAAYEDGGDSALPLTSEAEARAAVEAAAGGGIACTIHAIGDAAVRRALDLLSAAPKVGIPHRIEHFQCVHEADVRRAAAYGIVASMQPAHLPGDVNLAEERWGDRAAGAYACRRLLREGTVLALGSDVPVVTIDPRAGVVAAMDRVAADGGFPSGWNPSERLSFEEVVRGYTLGNAVAEGVQGRRGRLAPGMDADLVAWDVDAAVERGIGSAFREARVLLTVVGGEVVFRA
jgi:predicted amidohydrolase YtcJ